jgi:hypothetical protein
MKPTLAGWLFCFARRLDMPQARPPDLRAIVPRVVYDEI